MLYGTNTKRSGPALPWLHPPLWWDCTASSIGELIPVKSHRFFFVAPCHVSVWRLLLQKGGGSHPGVGVSSRGRAGLHFYCAHAKLCWFKRTNGTACKEWMCLERPNKSVRRASLVPKSLYIFSMSEPYILHCLLDVKEQNASAFLAGVWQTGS